MVSVGWRWRRKEWKQKMCQIRWALRARKELCECFVFVAPFVLFIFCFNFLLVSHSTINPVISVSQLWSPETGRRLWTLTLQCTTQTGSTHSCTSTMTVQRENVRDKHSTLSYCRLLILFRFFFSRPAHRDRKPAVPPTAHPGIRTIQQLTQFCTSASRSPQHAEKGAGV